MATANWFRYAYLAHVSRPKSVRQLFRLVKRHRFSRIVEVGISDMQRAVALVEVAQRFAGEQTISYTGIDWFDARSHELAPLKLKDAYRVLRATGANVRLVPGSPSASLVTCANAHANTDFIVIASSVEDCELERAWFYVPRMLHAASIVLREGRNADGEPIFMPIASKQLNAWAAAAGSRKAA